MQAIVCIKQVPETTEVKIDPERGTLIREGVPSIINPFDTYAIEEALRLREKFGGKVTVISMGPPQAMSALKEAIAMGADEAILLSDPAFAGADTWATAYTLAAAIRKIGNFDVIFCGRQAIDGDTGQTGPGIATQLRINQLTYVCKIASIDFEKKLIEVERLVEEGREVVRSALPCLITVVKDINQPRYPTILGIRRAQKVQIPVWTSKDLNVDPNLIGLNGSPTRVVKIETPPPRPGKCEIIQGDSVEQMAEILAEKLIAEKIIV
ncbi:MAG: electron transfer flavoprotein subunit beta/FixA family protein [Candidatus Saccharicenans sp.]